MTIVLQARVVGQNFCDLNLSTALRNAQKHAGRDGFVASLPQLVDARILADENAEVWKNGYTANSEENVGKTKEGSPLLLVVHGGGIWTPERIEQVYKDGLNNVYAGKLSRKEFTELVDGKLPDGSKIEVLTFKDFNEAAELPQKYAIVLDFNMVKELPTGGVQKGKDLRENPLFIARAGGRNKANAYLDKTEIIYTTKNLGNWHPFANVNPEEAQGRLLRISNQYYYDFNFLFSFECEGNFVGGIVSAEGTVKVSRSGACEEIIAKPTLEEVLAVANKFVHPLQEPSLKKELQKLYK